MTKRILYVILTVFTLYMGGMYWSSALLVLFFMEVLFFVFSFFYSLYSIKKLDIEIETDHETISKNSPTKAYIMITNHSILPVNNFVLDIAFKQNLISQEASNWKQCTGSISGHKHVKIELHIDSSYCGSVDIHVHKLYVYDYLSLFVQKQDYSLHKDILVIPTEERLSMVSKTDMHDTNPLPIYTNIADTSMSDFNPREYMEGDSIRHIHWKLTAKTQDFWTKEYYDEETQVAMMTLDLYNQEDISLQQWDAFLQIVSAFSLGLLDKQIAHYIIWFDIMENQVHKQFVQNRNDYLHMITSLIITLKFNNQGYVTTNLELTNALCLDTSLQVSYKQKTILQFTTHNYKEEIQATWIQI